MIIMNKASVQCGDYRYRLEFVSKYDDCEDLYNFIKTPIGGASWEREVILMRITNKEMDSLYKDPEASWIYYRNIYEHRTPKHIICKFDKKDRLRYYVKTNYMPTPSDIYNEVIEDIQYCDGYKYGFPKIGTVTYDNDEMDAGPLYRINLWIDRDKEVSDYKEEIKAIINKYLLSWDKKEE